MRDRGAAGLTLQNFSGTRARSSGSESAAADVLSSNRSG